MKTTEEMVDDLGGADVDFDSTQGMILGCLIVIARRLKSNRKEVKPMRYKDILRAQERDGELREEIKGYRKLWNELGEAENRAGVGYKIVDRCRAKVTEKINNLKKEWAELEV